MGNLRTVIFFAIVIAVLVFFQWFLRPKSKPAETPAPAPAAETTRAPAPAPVATAPAPAPWSTPAPRHAVPAESIVVENDLVRAVFVNPGGVLASYRLKKLPQAGWRTFFEVNLLLTMIKPYRLTMHRGAELLAPGHPLFTTAVTTGTGPVDLSGVGFRARRVDATTVEFQYDLPGGGIRKTFTLGDRFALGAVVETWGDVAGYTFDCDRGLSPTEPDTAEDASHFSSYVKLATGLNAQAAVRLKKTLQLGPQVSWAGLKTKYFFLGIIPTQPFDAAQVAPRTDSTLIAGRGPLRNLSLRLARTRPDARDSLRVYFGPLEYGVLAGYRVGFENAVHLGGSIIKPFSVAILWLLRLFFQLFRNYGIAIILFTILMKGVFYPLSAVSYRSMRQMQLLQPKIEEMRRKYKDDPQRLNQETMQLYRTYKINPLSGCLPLLIQMPVFWALYAVFRTTFELRLAPLGLWLNALSLHDPYYILPLLMGASFLLQSSLTSVGGQQKFLQYFMPLFMTVIFLNFPAGLQLYWLFFNILSIVEQMIIRRGGITWTRTKPLPAPPTR